MRKCLLHFRTITKHRHMVIRHCFKAGIPFRGLFHDLSKYGPAEFIVGVKYYQGNRSPNEAEREAIGYSTAWMHHNGRNRHHFEYWTDYNPVTKLLQPIPMPYKYVVEMFCDRVSASKNYMKDNYTDSSPLEYFLSAKEGRFIHPETSDQIEGLLRMLANEGEQKTFSFIRNRLASGRG